MSGDTRRPLIPIPSNQVDFLVATAARAPSVQNTQPWRFRAGRHWIELHVDPGRQLRVDPLGREVLISCGAALFGLLLARVSFGAAERLTAGERRLLDALPHRHTHRGPFSGAPLPPGLLAGLKR